MDESPPPAPDPSELARLTGGEVDRVRVTFRAFGDALDPAAVTRLLGVAPTGAHAKGDRKRVQPPGYEVYEYVQPTGAWSLGLPDSAEWELGDAVGALLDRLPDDPAVWAQLGHLKLEMFCGVWMRAWNRATTLAPGLLRRLGERGIALELDLYYEGGADVDDPRPDA